MNRTFEAKLLRVSAVAVVTFAVLLVVVGGADRTGISEKLQGVLPFLCVALICTLLIRLRGRLDTTVERVTRYREVTPYSTLAEAAQRLQAGSLEEALPGLAQALRDGTGADRAVIWLAVGERLVAAAAFPVDEAADGPDTVENLAVLLARPGTGHVVPVLDGSTLRAVLAVDKPHAPITPADQVLIQDVANGAGLLLRGVALNAELSERVRRADALADELQASRRRLTRAREVERRRLLAELSRVTTGRLLALRDRVAQTQDELDRDERHRDEHDDGAGASRARSTIVAARSELDELIDRFRIIARGVYPAVLRGQGPGAALEELAADLPRPVRLGGDLDVRLPWEIESGIYYAVAAVLNVLAAHPAEQELGVRMVLDPGRLVVVIDDPSPTVDAGRLRELLIDDAERLAALGGDLIWPEAGPTLQLHVWLPDHFDPMMGAAPLAEPARP